VMFLDLALSKDYTVACNDCHTANNSRSGLLDPKYKHNKNFPIPLTNHTVQALPRFKLGKKLGTAVSFGFYIALEE